MGAAGVLESLLRSIARLPRPPDLLAYEAQVHQATMGRFNAWKTGTRYVIRCGAHGFSRQQMCGIMQCVPAIIMGGVSACGVRKTTTMGLTARHACVVQAALLAHTMLHHPRAWPKQETALALLVTLRKFLQTEWVRRRPPGVMHL